ncbi:MAG: Hpt domain-containing protein [Bdellovibrionota bacterium]|nr:Hpt domain-containing protein [Bdellovibrionota bacterium]
MSNEIHVTIDKDLEDIMPMFLENRQKDLNALKGHLETMDIESIQTIGHRLAGNAGSYGLEDLGHIGAAIEDSCISKDEAGIRENCQKYSEFMSLLKISYAD